MLDTRDAKVYAQRLVSGSLLQPTGDGQYRLHDLQLDFLKLNIRSDPKRVQAAADRQARYLGRREVLESYYVKRDGRGGVYVLMSLWHAVEDLSGKSDMAVGVYHDTLEALGEGVETTDGAQTIGGMARFFELRGKYAEAEPLYRGALAIMEATWGPEHPSVATELNNLALLLRAQGKTEEARQDCERAYVIQKNTLGLDNPRTHAVQRVLHSMKSGPVA